MKKLNLLSFITFCIFFISENISICQNSLEFYRESVDSLFAEFDSDKSPGMGVLIVKEGKILLNKGYGMANLEHNIPINPVTVFDVASVSKQFTAFAISSLIEQGKIKPEDDIRKYIPELHDFGTTITIAHLIHHTSGFRNWTNMGLANLHMDLISYGRIMNMAYNQKDLNFIPGSEYSYSNTGYNILAELVKRVTGKSLREWTDKNIFQPLGMKNTHFRDNEDEIIMNKADSYFLGNDGKLYGTSNTLTAVGSSSLFTTTTDMAKWMINLDNPVIGGKSVIERMFRQGILNNGEKISYAYGFFVNDYRGAKRISHGGSWANFRSCVTYFPEHHFSVVILSNYTVDACAYTQKIADIYLGDKLKPVKLELSQDIPVVNAYKIPLRQLDNYTGTFKLEPGKYISIYKDNNQLKCRLTMHNAFQMIALSDSTFLVEENKTSILYIKDRAGQITGIKYKETVCSKMKELSDSDLSPLDDYSGYYLSRELMAPFDISVSGNQLIINNLHRTYSLIRAWGDDFYGTGIMSYITFYRDKLGNVQGFTVTDNTNRNHKFEKY